MPVKSTPKISVNKSNEFVIEFSNFYQGYSPAAHINPLTELGSGGHASVMTNVDILDPTHITQGPGLADLTNGTQAGVVDQLITFILDQPTSADVSFVLGTTKLFKISSTAVASGGSPSWPRTITNMTDGESLIELKGNLYYFYNTSSAGDIGKYDLVSTFTDAWGSVSPTGAAALQKALHPVGKKEDIMVFGNGRYVGTYIVATNTLAPTKLDFGNDAEVADVVFHANQWLIAVNYGATGSNRTQSQILLWDGGAVSSILDDEAAVGLQRIGFIMPIGGIVYVAYQDLTFSAGYMIGYLSGRKIVPIGYFTGTLPGFHQKTQFKNTILYVANALIWSTGAVLDDLPIQTSQLADGGYATVGALAAPFGTPMVASSDGGSNHRLAKFSGFDITGNWKSVVVPTVSGRMMGQIDEVVVMTKHLGSSARCDLKFEYNQAQSTTTLVQITTAGKRRHIFTGESFNFSSDGIEDIRLFLDWSNGNAGADCAIRKVFIKGHYIKD